MGGSVTECYDCGNFTWANGKPCETCGSTNLAPSLRQVHAYMMENDLAFREMVEKRKYEDSHCPMCGSEVNREGFRKEVDYSEDSELRCKNCGYLLIRVIASVGSGRHWIDYAHVNKEEGGTEDVGDTDTAEQLFKWRDLQNGYNKKGVNNGE